MKLFSAKVMLRALSALTVVVTLSGTALSSGNVSFESSNEDGKVVVSLENIQARKVSLTIENLDGTAEFYSTKVNGNEDFKKVFDLSNLEDGSYVLVARFENNTLKKEFTVKNSEVVSSNKTIDLACQPVFKNTEEGLIVLFQCPTKDDVSVSFNTDFKTFFTHNAKNSKLATKYNVSALPEGNYEIVLSAGEYEFSYDFEIE